MPAHAAVVPVPEVRDYHQINRRLIQLLDAGAPRVVLAGVEHQRLLVAGLRGPWEGVIEIQGNAGPELAAGLDAPGLLVICRGSSDDGAGRGLIAGTLLLKGPSGIGVGYGQAGGQIVAEGSVGPRAGLEQRGGVLLLFKPAGPLIGERRRDGWLVLLSPAGYVELDYAARGGRSLVVTPNNSDPLPGDHKGHETLVGSLNRIETWLEPTSWLLLGASGLASAPRPGQA